MKDEVEPGKRYFNTTMMQNTLANSIGIAQKEAMTGMIMSKGTLYLILYHGNISGSVFVTEEIVASAS